MRRLRFEPRAAAIGRSVRRKAILWTAALLLGAAWTAPGPVWAAHPLQGELESMFGALSNFTSPGAFESARRGVIAGGGLSVRNRTYDIQLAAFVPPSFKGGCGGIDIFLGSFSYISLDQFLSFLRAIAAQAAGYAFQMALASSCDLCVKIMESMRKAAQLMNNLNMNSCQLAQGIVTNDFKSIDSMSNSIAAVASGLAGITEDMTGTLAESKTPLGLVESASAPEAKRAIADIAGGNIVWNALTKSAVNDWFGLSADDPSIKEALMSITGTIVVTPADDPDGRGRTISRASYPGGLLTLQDLVEGTARGTEGSGAAAESQTKIYSCEGDKTECLMPRRKTPADIRGLAPVIYDALAKSGGIIDKFARYQPGQTFTAQEQSILAALPAGTGAMLRNLSLASAQTAKVLAYDASRVTALAMSRSLALSLIDAAENAMAQTGDASKLRVADYFRDARERLAAEAAALQSQYGTPATLIETGETYLRYAQFPKPVHPGSALPQPIRTAR